MNPNIKVSVIVPVYNVEDYICDTLNSLINQTLKEIEIICVDDCSTDSSYELLTSFKKKDNRIKILRNTKNEGVGYSRNKALKKAKGEYISFLDSDDWLNNKSLEELYNKSSENNLDILMFKAITYYHDSGNYVKTDYYSMKNVKKYFNKVFDYKKLDKYKLFKIPNCVWNKFIKRSLITDNTISFPEGLIFEDVPFFYKLMFSAKRMMITDDYYLFRRIRDNSITTSYNIKFIDAVNISDLVMEFFLENNYYNEYKRQLLNNFISVQKNRFYKISLEYKEQFFNEMKENVEKYVYQYNLKEDFEKELYRPNKSFINLILNSSEIDDFNKNVNETKNIQKYYEYSIAVEISNYDLKKINNFFRVVRNQKIDFENIEIILLVKSYIFEENNILDEYNDLYNNIKVLNSDSLKENYENEINRIKQGQKLLFLNEKRYDSEEYMETIKEFISCDGEKMNKNIINDLSSKNVFHKVNPNQRNYIELNSEKNLSFFDFFNNTVVHNVLQQDKGIQGQYTDCWSEENIVQRQESNTILKNESNNLLFSFLMDNDKKRLILPISFKIKFRYINHDNVSLRLANLGGSYINISLNSLDLETNDEILISYTYNRLKIYVNDELVKTNEFVMMENKGYITWRLPEKSFIKFNDFVLYTEEDLVSTFFTDNSHDEDYSKILEELIKLEERIDEFKEK